MLQLGGQALAHWRRDVGDRGLILRLAAAGVHCTRLDLARDTSGVWTPYRLREFLDAERYVTKWGSPLYTQTKDGPLTVQMGSRKSDIMLRCYDKRGEMLAKGKPCDLPRLSRWEFEIKGDLAPLAFRQVVELSEEIDPATGVASWPLERLHAAWTGKRLKLTRDVIVRSHKNQTRAPAHPEWSEWLARAARSILVPDGDERTLVDWAADFARYVKSSAVATIAAVIDLMGPAGIEALLWLGRQRYSAKHRELLAHRAETSVVVRDVFGLPPDQTGA